MANPKLNSLNLNLCCAIKLLQKHMHPSKCCTTYTAPTVSCASQSFSLLSSDSSRVFSFVNVLPLYLEMITVVYITKPLQIKQKHSNPQLPNSVTAVTCTRSEAHRPCRSNRVGVQVADLTLSVLGGCFPHLHPE